MRGNFPKLEYLRARPKISLHAKNQPWESSSFFNQLCTYKHIYTYIYIYIYTLSGQKYLYTFQLCHMAEICKPLKVISTEDNFKRFNISNHRLNLK